MSPQTQRMRDFDAFKTELENGSDRAVIVIGGSLIELGLEECLLAVLRPPISDEEKSRLFSSGGIAETFSQKISACYFLRIVSLGVRKDLDTIRKIRNLAAHHLNPISFDDQQISDLCKNISYSRSLTVKSNRDKFKVCVMVLAGMLFAHAATSAGTGEIRLPAEEPKPGLGGAEITP
jgi:hypothetical protein